MSTMYRKIRAYLEDAAPEWRTQSQVIKAMRQSKWGFNPNIMVQLNRLVKDGHVELQPHPQDHSKLRYRWTGAGAPTADVIEQLMAHYDGEWVARTDIAHKLGFGTHNQHLLDVLDWLAENEASWEQRFGPSGADEYRYQPSSQ